MTTKPYNTTAEQPTAHDRPHHRPVLEMVAVWMLAAVSATVAVLLGGVAMSMDASTRFTGAVQLALGIVALLFLAAAVALFGYARLEHGAAYPRREKQDKPTGGGERVIYTHNEVKPKQGGGYTVEATKHEARFTDGVREVARGVAWMLAHGKSDRRSVKDGLGWGPDKFNRVMRELEQFGMATNKGRGTGNGWQIDPKAHDWTKSLEAEIDDLVDEMDRW